MRGWWRVALVVLTGLAVTRCGISIETLPNAPCAGTDVGDFRVVVKDGSVGLQSVDDGTVSGVVWPSGFSAERRSDGIALLDADGAVVAREGQVIHIGGGRGGTGTISVCDIGGVAYP